MERVRAGLAEFEASVAGADGAEVEDRRAAEHADVLEDALPFPMLVVGRLEFEFVAVVQIQSGGAGRFGPRCPAFRLG